LQTKIATTILPQPLKTVDTAKDGSTALLFSAPRTTTTTRTPQPTVAIQQFFHAAASTVAPQTTVNP